MLRRVGLVVWMLSIALPALGEGEKERVSELLTRGREIRAEQIHPSIWLASGTSNAYLVATPDGAVVIDTGNSPQAVSSHLALQGAVGDLAVAKLVLTHAHEDHVGGVARWQGDGVEVIAHRYFPLRQHYYAMLEEYRARRNRVLWSAVVPEDAKRIPVPQVRPDVLVDDVYAFELGGVRFEVIATPGGEGPDAVSVWVPAYRALFTGDALGPTQASFPNLFTLRGENLREPIPMLASLERMRALDAELLLPGHFDPLRGREQIREQLKRTADGIRYVVEATVAGMNEGKDLFTLMREVKLPPELALSEQYGRVPWGVRAIWELHTGWFRFESTTELFEVPPRVVYPELAALAGGPGKLALRATAHVQAGRPLEALHLAEVALAADPTSRPALEAQLEALRLLAKRDEGRNFQIAGWLRHRIGTVEAQLAELP